MGMVITAYFLLAPEFSYSISQGGVMFWQHSWT